MGRQYASGPERSSGRLYYGESYEDSPAPLPIAAKGLSAAFTRRRAVLIRDANDTIRGIDRALDNNDASTSPAPPPESAPRPVSPELEDEIYSTRPTRRRLGSLAMTSADTDTPQQQQAA